MKTPTLPRLLLLLCLAPGAALATSGFPATLQSELSLSSQPSCTVCHQGETMMGTVTTPFGAALRARGLQAYDEASLRTALTALREEQVDSDGDGTPDVAELQAGSDPNHAPATAAAPALLEPRYGCSAASGPAGGAALLLALGLLLTRRAGEARE